MTQASSTKPDLLVIRALMPDQMAQLESEFSLLRFDQANDKDAFLSKVGPQIRGVVTSGATGFSRNMLASLPALEIVASSSVGTDSIDVVSCHEKGIHVTNTPDVLNDDVADLGIGLILNALRCLGAGHDYVRSGDWARKGMMPLTTAVTGKRLGIVGLGRIGHELANRAAALKMQIFYTGRTRQDVGYTFHDSLIDLAQNTDILALTCPGGKQTHHIVDAAVLKALGPQGWVVNLSRGSVIDEAALLDALTHRTIAGAALDVYDNEPNIDPRFTTLNNAILYPHHASGTTATREAMSQLVVDNLRAHFQHKPLVSPV